MGKYEMEVCACDQPLSTPQAAWLEGRVPNSHTVLPSLVERQDIGDRSGVATQDKAMTASSGNITTSSSSSTQADHTLVNANSEVLVDDSCDSACCVTECRKSCSAGSVGDVDGGESYGGSGGDDDRDDGICENEFNDGEVLLLDFDDNDDLVGCTFGDVMSDNDDDDDDDDDDDGGPTDHYDHSDEECDGEVVLDREDCEGDAHGLGVVFKCVSFAPDCILCQVHLLPEGEDRSCPEFRDEEQFRRRIKSSERLLGDTLRKKLANGPLTSSFDVTVNGSDSIEAFSY